ncbi:MAG TPA: LuxR C-terminal-related transcriptional regulator [Gaiellaceae bacterium]|nr:LuxR C-terminal-related transcriptional regulator [Gaiellaceae bacterium]
MTTAVDGLLAAGRDALRRAAWADARTAFEQALAAGETVEALEGLGSAARWQMDGAQALAAHERAWTLARGKDDRTAARLAIELAFDCGQFRGDAEANGWLERAAQLLERLTPQPEHALLAYLRGNRALNGDHDPVRAAELAAAGVEAARAADASENELACLALEGLALVAGGDVAAGMGKLDAATAAAVAGEIQNVRIVEVICCHLIDACQRVRDLERAAEWCHRVRQISDRYGDAEIFATCRTHYADLLVWRGEWPEAEEALMSACRNLAGVPRKVVDGLVRLAELRRRQGRVEQAEALLAEAEGHRAVMLVRAAIALDRADARGAHEQIDRYLRRVGPADHFDRVPALELAVRASLALDERSGGEAAARELDEIAARVGTSPLRAAALLARGRVAAGVDPDAARAALEDAVDLFDADAAPYEASQARLDLAGLLRELGRPADAGRVESEARAVLARLGSPTREPGPAGSPLTRREREVLRLVAGGISNDAIAAQLFLSVRTVERHVENIYDKIGVSGRTARAAATAWAIGHGVA